jgi:hypothetical protein
LNHAPYLLASENYKRFPLFRIICVLEHSSQDPRSNAKQNSIYFYIKTSLVLKGWSSSLKTHQKELGVVPNPNVSISRVK